MQQFPPLRIGEPNRKDEAENGDNGLIMHTYTPVFNRARAARCGRNQQWVHEFCAD